MSVGLSNASETCLHFLACIPKAADWPAESADSCRIKNNLPLLVLLDD